MKQHEVPIQVVLEKPAHADKPKMIIHDVPIPDRLKKVEKTNKPADFLSAHTQRVKQQMRAAQAGPTRNNIGRQIQNNGHSVNAGQEQTHNRGPRKPGAGHHELSFYDALAGAAMSSVNNRNIRIGNMTVLNTDRFLYYSFYSRLDSMVTYRWLANVEAAGRNAQMKGELDRFQRDWVTNVEAILDPHGNVKKIIVMRPSGWHALDMAPILAFRAASPIPHPPAGMVRSDGYIHIYYSFTVYPQ